MLHQKRGGWLGGRPLLRKGFLVEVQDDRPFVVRVTGTSYTASYYRIANSTDLIARHLPLRDDHRAPMSRLRSQERLETRQ